MPFFLWSWRGLSVFKIQFKTKSLSNNAIHETDSSFLTNPSLLWSWSNFVEREQTKIMYVQANKLDVCTTNFLVGFLKLWVYKQRWLKIPKISWLPPLNLWGCNQQLAYPYWCCSRACNFGSSVQASLIAAKKPGPPECLNFLWW